MNNEKEETQGEQQETGQQSETSKSILEKAEAAATRIEEANKKQEELILRQENLVAQNMLGGKTEAGAMPPEPKEETNSEYRQRIESEIRTGKFS